MNAARAPQQRRAHRGASVKCAALRAVLAACLACIGCASSEVRAQAPASIESFAFTGTCDASAIIAIDRDRFVLADDEDNVIRLCSVRPSPHCAPLFDASALLGSPGSPAKGEADFEGAARVGERIYWVASHGRSRKGKLRSARYSLLATRLVESGSGPDSAIRLEPIGTNFRGLAAAIEGEPLFRDAGLPESLRLKAKRVEALAPKAKGFNIEGLAAQADGALWLGLRNPPAPGSHAAHVIEVRNAAELVAGGSAAPDFGPLRTFALGGRTIRSLEREPSTGRVFIVGGAIHKEIDAALFVVEPGATLAALHPLNARLGLDRLNPEGLAFTPDAGALWIVSDDGAVEDANGVECKDREGAATKGFRALRVTEAPGQGR